MDNKYLVRAVLILALLGDVLGGVALYASSQPIALFPDGGISPLATNQKITTNREGTILQILNGGKIDVQSGSTLEVDSGATETHAGTTTWTGLLNANAGIAVDTNKFTVADGTGHVVSAGSVTAYGLEATDSITGTIKTATQNSITKVGKQTSLSTSGALNTDAALTAASGNITTSLTAYGLQGTAITGTLGTAAQPNVTSVGKLSSASVTGALNTDAGLTASTAVVSTTLTANGNLRLNSNGVATGTLTMNTGVVTTSLTAYGIEATDSFTGTMKTAAQPNITSLGKLSSLSTSGALNTDAALTAGSATITGTTALVGAATFTANPILPSESITPTDGADITISKVLVTLTPAGDTGNSLAACTSGNIAFLYNSLNQSVVISDTGNFIGAGNQTLGQYDTLHLVCIGTKWVQIGAVSAN